jgi:hypothetical protein
MDQGCMSLTILMLLGRPLKQDPLYLVLLTATREHLLNLVILNIKQYRLLRTRTATLSSLLMLRTMLTVILSTNNSITKLAMVPCTRANTSNNNSHHLLHR